jgi:hypothetical protein
VNRPRRLILVFGQTAICGTVGLLLLPATALAQTPNPPVPQPAPGIAGSSIIPSPKDEHGRPTGPPIWKVCFVVPKGVKDVHFRVRRRPDGSPTRHPQFRLPRIGTSPSPTTSGFPAGDSPDVANDATPGPPGARRGPPTAAKADISVRSDKEFPAGVTLCVMIPLPFNPKTGDPVGIGMTPGEAVFTANGQPTDAQPTYDPRPVSQGGSVVSTVTTFTETARERPEPATPDNGETEPGVVDPNDREAKAATTTFDVPVLLPRSITSAREARVTATVLRDPDVASRLAQAYALGQVLTDIDVTRIVSRQDEGENADNADDEAEADDEADDQADHEADDEARARDSGFEVFLNLTGTDPTAVEDLVVLVSGRSQRDERIVTVRAATADENATAPGLWRIPSLESLDAAAAALGSKRVHSWMRRTGDEIMGASVIRRDVDGLPSWFVRFGGLFNVGIAAVRPVRDELRVLRFHHTTFR